MLIEGTNFGEAEQVSFGDGITVDSFTVDSATQITASIIIDTDAGLEARDVSVANSSTTGTLANSFTVEGISNEGGGNMNVSGNHIVVGLGIVGILWGGGYYLIIKKGI